MQTHPTTSNHSGTEHMAAVQAPRVAVFGRERNRTSRLCALARTRGLDAREGALPPSDADLDLADLLLIDGGELSAEDRLWIRGVLSAQQDKAVIVVSETGGVQSAVELISDGVDDVLDGSVLTSGMLARAVHMALARRRSAPQRKDVQKAPAQKSSSPAVLTLLQECASAILMVNPDGIVSFANPEAENLLGVPEGSLTGSPFALELNKDAREEVVLDGPNGRQVHAEVRIVETDHGDVPMRVVTLQDVSLRRALEKHFAA